MGRLESILATRLKRKTQTCKVFEIKIDNSHLSKKNKEHLNSIFTEAKWFYNYCVGLDKLDNADTTAKEVPVKIIDRFENRKFSVLKAHMKQGIKKRLYSNIRALSSLKKQGKKIGKIKFKSKLNSVVLPEYGRDFGLDFEGKRIRILGMKQWLKAIGLGQIAKDKEIANATLIKRVKDYYLHITTFVVKEETSVPDKAIGIDFGCQTQLTLSDGTKLEFQVPVSKRIKRLDRKIMRKNRAKSNNKFKDQLKRQKEHNRLNNKKKDIRNKIVNAITKNYKYVVFQDESIHAWHNRRHGKKIQNSGIGGIIADLKNKSHTPIMIDKFFPSTKLCPSCGCLNKLSLSEREYKCECGYYNDRDIKSAQCILAEGLRTKKLIPTDRRDFKPVESEASIGSFRDTLAGIPGISCKFYSVKQEASEV